MAALGSSCDHNFSRKSQLHPMRGQRSLRDGQLVNNGPWQLLPRSPSRLELLTSIRELPRRKPESDPYKTCKRGPWRIRAFP